MQQMQQPLSLATIRRAKPPSLMSRRASLVVTAGLRCLNVAMRCCNLLLARLLALQLKPCTSKVSGMWSLPIVTVVSVNRSLCDLLLHLQRGTPSQPSSASTSPRNKGQHWQSSDSTADVADGVAACAEPSGEPKFKTDAEKVAFEAKVLDFLQAHGDVTPSKSAVIETCFCLIRSILCRNPRTERINKKQAIAILHFGVWLQAVMNNVWAASGELPDHDIERPGEMHFVLQGAGGTGKTIVLMIVKALLEFFTEFSKSMRVCAITNSATGWRRRSSCYLQVGRREAREAEENSEL